MSKKQSSEHKPAPPRMNPYILTILLFGFGAWCFKDGFMNPDPDYEHKLFNQVLSVVFLAWGAYDFYKLKKNKKKDEKQENSK